MLINTRCLHSFPPLGGANYILKDLSSLEFIFFQSRGLLNVPLFAARMNVTLTKAIQQEFVSHHDVQNYYVSMR